MERYHPLRRCLLTVMITSLCSWGRAGTETEVWGLAVQPEEARAGRPVHPACGPPGGRGFQLPGVLLGPVPALRPRRDDLEMEPQRRRHSLLPNLRGAGLGEGGVWRRGSVPRDKSQPGRGGLPRRLDRPVSMVTGAKEIVLPGDDYCFRSSSRTPGSRASASSGCAALRSHPPAMSFLKSFPPPASEDGLRLQQPDTEAVMNGKGLGTGTLYIAESRLSWLDGSGLGFSLEYPAISLHAVSRDPNAYPREHLYVMVNTRFGEESKDSLSDEDEEDGDEDVEPITEFRFVPSDKSALEAMFTAMCECQALHPDPEDEDSDDYDGEEYDVEAHEQGQGDIPTFYTYEEGLSHLTAEGQATLERLEGMLSQSVSSQYNMAGVRTDDSVRDYEDGMEVDAAPTVAGQFEDADVDH